MELPISANKDLLDVLLQVLLLVIPVVLSWFVRNYVKNSATETQIAAIIRLSNAAIDWVENLDKRGDLVLPEDVRKGTAKLKLAADWMENELKRNGISVGDEEAQKWIASEYQKRVGDLRPVSAIAELARLAVDLIQGFDREALADASLDPGRINGLAELAADWVVTQLAQQRGADISREEALKWVRAEMLQRLRVKQLPSGDTLMDLARQGVSFMRGLKETGQLSPPPGPTGEAVERDVATAWTLAEAAKLGLVLSPEQIGRAVMLALKPGVP